MLTPLVIENVLSSLPDPAFILSRDGKYLAVFGGSDERYYHDGGGLVGLSVHEVMEKQMADWFVGEIGKALDSEKLHVVEYELAGEDIRGLPDDGPSETLWFEGRIQALNCQVDGQDAVLWVSGNITARHRLNEELRAASIRDELTKLYNRRHFEEVASSEMQRALRYDQPVSLLIMDLDHFKVINDTFGHKFGDQILTRLGDVLTKSIRDSDTVARWGGEEFTVLLPGTGMLSAAAAAENIRAAVESTLFPDGLKVSLSIGVAEWSGGSESLDSWLSRADEALYQAKEWGRNRVEIAKLAEFWERTASRWSKLRWQERYECGDPEIDAQHKLLLEDTNRILSMLPKAVDDGSKEWPEISPLPAIDNLLDNTRKHFDWEEKKLEQLDWDGLKRHKKEHRRMMDTMRKYRDEFNNKELPTATSEFAAFLLVEIIANHLLRGDRDFYDEFRTG